VSLQVCPLAVTLLFVVSTVGLHSSNMTCLDTVLSIVWILDVYSSQSFR